MSCATATASARVPISCEWSKSSAPAQMRVTAVEYLVAGLGDACAVATASVAATTVVWRRIGSARTGRMLEGPRSTGAQSALNRRRLAAGGGCGILVRELTHVSFRILGRLEAVVDGRVVDLPSRRERALLGVLLLHVGDVVSIDALIDSVWGDAPPATARHMVHEYV